MPRLNNANELFRRLDTLQVFRQVSGGGSTTLAAAVTAAATTLNPAATTSFTSGDPVFIVGTSGTELNAITAVTPATAVPLLYPAVLANPSGSQLLEAVAASLGHIGEGGIQLGGTAPLTAINSALAAAPIAYIYGYGELNASLSLLGFNILNLQTMFGITESEIGVGSIASPFAGALSGANIGTQGIQCIRATGTRNDGSTIIMDFNDAKIEPTGSINLQRTAATELPCNLRFTTAIIRIYS